jgi:ABC-type sulfate transport system substrate-binding protein
VIDGLPADMVALALPLDVEKIVDAGLIKPNWARAYPNNSVGEWRVWREGVGWGSR